MAVTAFQARVLRLLAQSRVAGGETYIAGGLALNHQLRRPRISHDIDVFNNTYEAMLAAADAELSAALAAGEVVFHEGRICGAWPQIVG